MFTRAIKTATLAGFLLLSGLGALPMLNAPAASASSTCAEWKLPEDTVIYQSNGWKVYFWYNRDEMRWKAYGTTDPDGFSNGMDGRVIFTRADDVVEFTITWTNGSGGKYTGQIDQDGFVKGTARDKSTDQGPEITWRMQDVATCARR
jgi:hypothetical protein